MSHRQNTYVSVSVFLLGFLIGAVILSLFYYLILSVITRDPTHPFSQFQLFQPWMSILIVGFGIQMGLYFLLRRGFRLNVSQKKDAILSTSKETTIAAGAGGTMGGVSMVACCAHHAAEVAPILGLTGASVFLIEYQKEFLMFGITVNLFGILYMAWLIADKKHPKEIFSYVVSRKEAVS